MGVLREARAASASESLPCRPVPPCDGRSCRARGQPGATLSQKVSWVSRPCPLAASSCVRRHSSAPRFPLRATGCGARKGWPWSSMEASVGLSGVCSQGTGRGAGSHACHSRNRTPAQRVRLHGWADGAKPKRFRRSRSSSFLLVPVGPACHAPNPEKP